MASGLTRTVRSEWSGAILVCTKCSKKVGGGFGPKRRTSLAKALRRAFALKKGRKSATGVVEVKCLGVCPRDAVAVVDTARIARWHVVPVGADVEQVGEALGLQA